MELKIAKDGWQDISKTSERKLSDGPIEVNIAAKRAIFPRRMASAGSKSGAKTTR
jgi:hypothetical protein